MLLKTCNFQLVISFLRCRVERITDVSGGAKVFWKHTFFNLEFGFFRCPVDRNTYVSILIGRGSPRVCGTETMPGGSLCLLGGVFFRFVMGGKVPLKTYIFQLGISFF